MNEAGKPAEKPPVGDYTFQVKGFIDIGTQDPSPNSKFKDAEPQRKCIIELALNPTKNPKSVRSDGKLFIISMWMTFSGGKTSNLGKMLRRWLGIKDARTYDVAELIDKVGQGEVTHSDDGLYANIGHESVMKAPGAKLDKRLSKVPTRTLFMLESEPFDNDVFESLSDKVKEKIMSSPEFDKYGPGADGKKKPTKKK